MNAYKSLRECFVKKKNLFGIIIVNEWIQECEIRGLYSSLLSEKPLYKKLGPFYKNTIWDGGSTVQIIGFLGLTDWTIEMRLGLNCV